MLSSTTAVDLEQTLFWRRWVFLAKFSRLHEALASATTVSYLAEIARSVVRYDPSYKSALRAFQRAYFGEGSRQSDDAFAEWLFERNPHRDPEGPALWLCVRDGKVVGQVASITSDLQVGEGLRRGGWLVDWMVDPEWRLKGVAPALFNAYARNTDVMLGLGIEDLAYRTAARAGWKDVGRLTLFVRPLDPGACASVLNAPKLVSKLAPRFLVAGSARVMADLLRAGKRVSVQPVVQFDERVNALWERVRGEYPVLVRRDFESLRWRFDESPQREHFRRYYFTRRGELIGYAVVRLAGWRGYVVGRMVDYLVERRSLSAVLAIVIQELSAQGAIAAFFEQCDAGAEKALRSLGCLSIRAEHRKRFMIGERDPPGPGSAMLMRGENWLILPADGDFDHILIAS